MAELVAASIFLAGYAAIALEQRLFINKAATSLLLAACLWVIVSLVSSAAELQHHLAEASANIFGFIVYLITAMTLVEILIHYHFFDIIERWLQLRRWTAYQMGWAMAFIAFGLATVLNDFTTTIVAIQIARHLFPKEARLTIGALIIIAANAGGSFSPIGATTTLMLWLAKKFGTLEIISQGILPALTLVTVASWLLLRHLKNQPLLPIDERHGAPHPSRSDRAIIAATLGSFALPLLASAVGLPPYLGLIAGLGGVWILIDIAKVARPQETHLKAKIRHFFKQVDMESIQFFLGLLLAVAALGALGLLKTVTSILLGASPSVGYLVAAFSGLGLISAVVDNVALTAGAINSFEGITSSLWVLFALVVATGGSIFIIGSAAGVVTTGMMPRLTFFKYVRIASLPALLSLLAAVGVWTVQHFLFFR